LEDTLRIAPDRFERQLRERLVTVPVQIAERTSPEGVENLPDRDLLTGLFNRVGFETELSKEVRVARDVPNVRDRASARVDELNRIHRALDVQFLTLPTHDAEAGAAKVGVKKAEGAPRLNPIAQVRI
jgi:hypothetical protein